MRFNETALRGYLTGYMQKNAAQTMGIAQMPAFQQQKPVQPGTINDMELSRNAQAEGVSPMTSEAASDQSQVALDAEKKKSADLKNQAAMKAEALSQTESKKKLMELSQKTNKIKKDMTTTAMSY